MELLIQFTIFALVSSAIYALISAGLTLTFGTLEFINFAHGDMAMIGAFTFYSLFVNYNLPLTLSLIITALAVGLIGILIEKTTFKPVRNKQAFIPLVLSIGISIILQSIAILIYGGGSKNFGERSDFAIESFRFMDDQVSISGAQIAIIVSSIILIALLYAFLKYSKTGKAIRAVSDDKQVAAIMGINVDRTITIIFAVSSALAAIAGVLIAFDQNLTPKMGLMLSIKAFAAIILGGVGKLHGAILGAFIIGFAENWIIGLGGIDSSYKELVVFVIFVTVLLIKPYGIFGGTKEEIESR